MTTGNSHPQRATSVPTDDEHFVCPGSGTIHPQAYLRIMLGPKVRFIRCPLPDCRACLFMRGEGWKRVRGLTRAEIARRNPNALIL